MSHTVLRGHPTASQIYLDKILDAVIKETKCIDHVKQRDQVNLAEIIYFCMRQKPNDLYMINGSSGEHITYGEILKYSIPLAQAIRAHNEEGKHVLFLMRNHQQMAALFYATLFSDVVPLMLDPNSTAYEIRHFLHLAMPYMVFCDEDQYEKVMTAVTASNNTFNLKVIIANSNKLLEHFLKGFRFDLNSFMISKAHSKSTVLLIPTSGSSGLPKATILTHSGLIAQLPILWYNLNHFPGPTERALLLSSAQWVTHTILMTTCPVYGVSLVMTPLKPTTSHVLEIVENLQPTWALLGPILLKFLAITASPAQLSSLETVIVTGAPLTQHIANLIKEKLPLSAHLGNGMGMTESHSFITMPAPGTAWESNGKIVNTFFYKIVAEDGTELDANQRGELYLKSELCIFKGYYNNEKAYQETVTPDGWYKTGDIFYRDKYDQVYFVERKKFWFKYRNYQIAPEELERVINSVPGVQDCVVCDSDKGPSAAVMLQPNQSPDNMTDLIHCAVIKNLSDYKRLRGGVYFVASLPCTHSGKIKRMECAKLIRTLTVASSKNTII